MITHRINASYIPLYTWYDELGFWECISGMFSLNCPKVVMFDAMALMRRMNVSGGVCNRAER